MQPRLVLCWSYYGLQYLFAGAQPIHNARMAFIGTELRQLGLGEHNWKARKHCIFFTPYTPKVKYSRWKMNNIMCIFWQKTVPDIASELSKGDNSHEMSSNIFKEIIHMTYQALDFYFCKKGKTILKLCIPIFKINKSRDKLKYCGNLNCHKTRYKEKQSSKRKFFVNMSWNLNQSLELCKWET